MCTDTALEDQCFFYEGILVEEQDEGPVLDTEAAASRVSAEYMQKDLVLPFPQAADELQVQLSTASFPTLFSTAKDREQSQHKASPPQGPLSGPLDRGALRTGEPHYAANSYTMELLAGGHPLKGQKFHLPALLLLPSCTMGLWTLHYTKLSGCELKGPKQLMLGC